MADVLECKACGSTNVTLPYQTLAFPPTKSGEWIRSCLACGEWWIVARPYDWEVDGI